MKKKFSGERLLAAREARCISGTGLSDLVGVSRSAISQYERGEKTPSNEILMRLAEKLNLRPHYFFQTQLKTEGPVFYRSLAAATKASRKRAQRRYEWLRELVAAIESYVEFPELRLPDFDIDYKNLSGEELETLAKDARRHFGLGDGPISNVTWLLENHGLILARHNLASAKLDAFSNRPRKNQGFVILGSEKKSSSRSRFDASHELAHLILHRNVSFDDLNDKELFKKIEQQANRFAGAFLLPRATYLSEVCKITLDGFLSLKERWGASVALMVRRCRDLELISQDTSKRMWINIGRRGWRKAEPKDDTMLIEQPRLISRSLEMVRMDDSGAFTELTSLLPWLEYELRELVGNESLDFEQSNEIAPPEPRVIKFPNSGS